MSLAVFSKEPFEVLVLIICFKNSKLSRKLLNFHLGLRESPSLVRDKIRYSP